MVRTCWRRAGAHGSRSWGLWSAFALARSVCAPGALARGLVDPRLCDALSGEAVVQLAVSDPMIMSGSSARNGCQHPFFEVPPRVTLGHALDRPGRGARYAALGES
jgi:hypothetical protein